MNLPWQIQPRVWRTLFCAATIVMAGHSARAEEAGVIAVVVSEGNESHGEYWLGVHVDPVADERAKELKLPKDHGLVVGVVFPGSPAAAAGLKANDVIVGADDKVLDSLRSLVDAVQAAGGKELKLQIVRGKEPKSITVRPTKRFATQWPLPPGAAGGFGWHALPGHNPWKPATLPKDMSIEIEQHGDGPLKLEIRHGEQKHEVTVDRLGDLPPELRGHVQAFVMQLPMRVNMAIVQRQMQELPQPRLNPVPPTEAKPESKPAENPKLPPKPQSTEKPKTDAAAEKAKAIVQSGPTIEGVLKEKLLPQFERLTSQLEKLNARVEALEQKVKEPAKKPKPAAKKKTDEK
jgi:hypothetical protein